MVEVMFKYPEVYKMIQNLSCQLNCDRLYEMKTVRFVTYFVRVLLFFTATIILYPTIIMFCVLFLYVAVGIKDKQPNNRAGYR